MPRRSRFALSPAPGAELPSDDDPARSGFGDTRRARQAKVAGAIRALQDRGRVAAVRHRKTLASETALDRRNFIVAAGSATVLDLAGCGGGGGSSPAPPPLPPPPSALDWST